jgi:MFS superfamily sulfate permease-like transporter
MPAWFFSSLQGYRVEWLPRDLVAGLMLAAIAIPGQLATARLAGMPPETGLYAFAAGSLAFAAFGANRFMSVAADSTIAPIFAGALSSIAAIGSAHYADLATLLAVLVGIMLLAVGLLRAGWLATLLSIPVTTGFLAGISIHIIVGELPALLGVSETQGHMLVRLVGILGRIGETNPYTLALGVGVLTVTIATAQISHRVPGALIGLVGAGLAVALFHLDARGVSVVGALAVPLPRLAVPVLPDIGELTQLVPLALVVAMVCIMQTAAVASTFPSDEDKPDNVSRDFAGVGAGSVLAGLIGSFAVDSSPPSTAIIRDSGGRSQIASLAAVAMMIALAVLASGLMAYVPRAALSGVLVYIAIKIFRVDEMVRIYSRGGREILLVAASAGLVVVLPIESGMLAGDRAVLRAQPLYRRSALLCGTGAGAGHHRVVAAGRERRGRTRARGAGARPCRAAQFHQRGEYQRQDRSGHRRPARAGKAPGHRGQRHHRYRLYGLAAPAAGDHRSQGERRHRRHRPAVPRTGPGVRHG